MPLTLPGMAAGMLPPYTYVPAQGPTGVIPAASIRQASGVIPPPRSGSAAGILPAPPGLPDRGGFLLEQVATVVRGRIRQSVFPPVADGGGYLSSLTSRIRSMDVIRGMDRILGKNTAISQGKAIARRSKNLGLLSTASAYGSLSGSLRGSSYGRAFDSVA